jgi:hypothetical protein
MSGIVILQYKKPFKLDLSEWIEMDDFQFPVHSLAPP